MKALKFIRDVALVALVIDVVGFVWWTLSGSLPADDFFIGTITWHFVHFWGSPTFWTVYPYALFAWVLFGPIVCAAYIGYRAKRRILSEAAELWEAASMQVAAAILAKELSDIQIKKLSERIAALEPKPKVKKLRVKSKRS